MPLSELAKRIIALRPASVTGDSPNAGVSLLQQLESDRGRIINSAAVRRLQQKTQVFALERNAAVRSRLTHSLEVQQNGRYIVKTILRQLGPQLREAGLEDFDSALETLVEMACLTHDIGNPPFGHYGEYVITDWFSQHLGVLWAGAVKGEHSALRSKMLKDLSSFEGNAQAIRVVVSLLRLNLTYSQTAAMLKYVRPAYQPAPAAGEPAVYLSKKPGFYLSEERFVAELYQQLQMASSTRHPVAYIMEAADDIAYCMADIEDAVEKGLLALPDVARLLLAKYQSFADPEQPVAQGQLSFAQILAQATAAAEAEPINKVGVFFISLRVGLVHPLVQHAAGQFIEHLESILAGTLDRALLEDQSPTYAIVRSLKAVAVEQVFCHAEVETQLLQGNRILRGLLDFYQPLLAVSAERFIALTEGRCRREEPYLQMLARRIPNLLVKAYRQALMEQGEEDWPAWEFYLRCRLLQDFVSGMTDYGAQDEYQILAAQA